MTSSQSSGPQCSSAVASSVVRIPGLGSEKRLMLALSRSFYHFPYLALSSASSSSASSCAPSTDRRTCPSGNTSISAVRLRPPLERLLSRDGHTSFFRSSPSLFLSSSVAASLIRPFISRTISSPCSPHLILAYDPECPDPNNVSKPACKFVNVIDSGLKLKLEESTELGPGIT
ncbi:hypothetical protein CVT25_001176 [Psilocybe cyanescens]|uniref:Uncharacterized protein n=1 Tax=Psilocybe cyanescens TaxID=93625 RepID=A0A409XKE7_PSICY|nr:hypothetical protein CVT25_001176 [Psilocybe cyanescens]